MKDKPRRLLCDFQVLGEGDAGNPLRMVRDHPNCHKPLTQRQLSILEDRADLDRKALTTSAALERLAVGEMIDAAIAAIGAELAIAPTDRPQMVDTGLLV